MDFMSRLACFDRFCRPKDSSTCGPQVSLFDLLRIDFGVIGPDIHRSFVIVVMT